MRCQVGTKLVEQSPSMTFQDWSVAFPPPRTQAVRHKYSASLRILKDMGSHNKINNKHIQPYLKMTLIIRSDIHENNIEKITNTCINFFLTFIVHLKNGLLRK